MNLSRNCILDHTILYLVLNATSFVVVAVVVVVVRYFALWTAYYYHSSLIFYTFKEINYPIKMQR